MRTIGAGSWWSADFRFESGDTQQRGTMIVEDRAGQPRTKYGPPGWVVVPHDRRPPISLDAVRASNGILSA